MGRPLGKGGQGRVFEGTNTKGGYVALKIMRFSNSQEKEDATCQVSTSETLTCLGKTKNDEGHRWWS